MARHVPHVFVPGPWAAPTLAVQFATQHHLERVLRRRPGQPVTYTDGNGTIGSGRYEAEAVVCGDEEMSSAPWRTLTVAVAAPHSTDRARLIVEKLGELGVEALVWLDTEHGAGRAPKPEKAAAWAVSALEQSHGARLLHISGPRDPTGGWDETLELLVADPAGRPIGDLAGSMGAAVAVLVGPEGGFAPGEVPETAIPVSLGRRILRGKTAAIVAAAIFTLTR